MQEEGPQPWQHALVKICKSLQLAPVDSAFEFVVILSTDTLCTCRVQPLAFFLDGVHLRVKIRMMFHNFLLIWFFDT